MSPFSMPIVSYSNFTGAQFFRTVLYKSYFINATGCGECPNSTVSNSLTCINRLGSSIQTCALSIQTVTCNNVIGTASSQITFKVQGKHKKRIFLFFSIKYLPSALCAAILVCISLLLILDTSGESNRSVSIVSEYDSQTGTLKRVFLEFNALVSM